MNEAMLSECMLHGGYPGRAEAVAGQVVLAQIDGDMKVLVDVFTPERVRRWLARYARYRAYHPRADVAEALWESEPRRRKWG
jgi:hypothetical protein